MNYIHPYYPIFTYFNEVLEQPSWDDKNILDFGGNAGNFLKDPKCSILPGQYTCLDVDKVALAEGKLQFPQANWTHYNRYNCVYNKIGFKDAELPRFKKKFDFILSFSVFTHTTKVEMIKTVENDLMPILSDTGRLAMTFLAPEHINYFIDLRLKKNATVSKELLLLRTMGLSHFYYINDNIITTEFNDEPNEKIRHMLSFYDPTNIQKIFKKYKTVLYVQPNRLLQYCLILQK